MTSHKRPQQRFGVIGPVLAALTALVLIAGVGWFVLDRTSDVLTSQDRPLTTTTDESSATPPVTPSATGSRWTTPTPVPTATPTRPKATRTTPTPARRRSTTAPSRDGSRTPKPSPRPTRTSTKPTATKTTTTAPSGGSGTPEAQVLKLTNDERAKAGCGPLRTNSALTRSAEGHAADMVDRHYFSHDSLDGRSPFDRMKAAGFRGGAMAENIAVGYQSPAAVVEGWMNSDGHRRNILNCTYTMIGVGYDAGQVKPEWGNGSWVQNFGG
ncbi:CAP domain-containing protein [Kribbella turkmenica]|uniref:CAP domain-containing protein n=1 Tax=Kribbella turkmenica TaxID=2530375 RepID=A0A4R4WP34_9ACTN|nr:CAP domain-containing protein [Kribbella turkmenica]TDD17945.1 CAP domain-containing protein [Kribbella turkmenica]